MAYIATGEKQSIDYCNSNLRDHVPENVAAPIDKVNYRYRCWVS